MDALNESLQKIGQHIYSGPTDGSGDGAAQGDGSAAKPKSEEEDVVDAEYKEV